MSLFDQLVNEALRSRAELTTLRPVVEKELLHHDILREMSEAGLLEQSEQPAKERTKERLHIVLSEAREETQDRIITRETLEAKQRVQSRVKAQPIAVGEAGKAPITTESRNAVKVWARGIALGEA